MSLQVLPPNYTFDWDADSVRALRHHLGYSQSTLARELGVRQQTVSEWETGAYRPRGASARLLTLVAREAQFDLGRDAASGDHHSPSVYEDGSGFATVLSSY